MKTTTLNRIDQKRARPTGSNIRRPTYPLSPSHPFIPLINDKILFRIPDEEGPEELIIRKPRADAVAAFRGRFPELFQGGTHPGARSRYEVNLLNVDDLLENWQIFPASTQATLVKIIESDWIRTNTAHWGIKKRPRERKGLPFTEHMILLATMEVGNLVHYGHRIVSSNIMDDRGFRDPNRSGLSIIDPREATRRINKWKKLHRPQNLMNKMGAMILLFPSPDEIQLVGEDTWRSRVEVNKFFKQVEGRLRRWKEKGYIRGFYASHEIGVGSIGESQLRPHTHAVIWLQNADLKFLKRAEKKGSVQYLPRVHTKWSTLCRFLPYTMRVCRIAPSYRLEFPEMGEADEVVRFNIKAIHTLGKVVELWKHTHEGTKKRVIVSGIPGPLDGNAVELDAIDQ